MHVREVAGGWRHSIRILPPLLRLGGPIILRGQADKSLSSLTKLSSNLLSLLGFRGHDYSPEVPKSPLTFPCSPAFD
jgi:hypothetical protein